MTVPAAPLFSKRTGWPALSPAASPLGTLTALREQSGPIFVNRYNLYTAASISGGLRPGVSSGEVIADVDRAAGTIEVAMTLARQRVQILRVHDVAAVRPALLALQAAGGL